MPSRKSEPRKSDVTTARFALADDDDEPSITASVPAAATTEADASPQASSLSPVLDRKDKDQDGKEKDGKDDKDSKDKDKDGITIEDLILPKSIITRLAKGVLPPNTQIQGNAILAISKSATVFISYLAAHANENTMNANKKTVSPADVFKALEEVELGSFRERLEVEFEKFNAIQTEKRTSYRQKVRAAKRDPNSSTTNPGDDTQMTDADADADADATINTVASAANNSHISDSAGGGEGPPRAKKQRVDPSAPGEHDDAETDVEEDAEDEQSEEHGNEEEDDEEEEEEEEGDEDEEDEDGRGGGRSGDETQDALEERPSREGRDEALDGDDSD